MNLSATFIASLTLWVTMMNPFPSFERSAISLQMLSAFTGSSPVVG